ncbi:MAG: hypothetical protein JO090_05465 [Rhizobacter sp.]|nr:hypothetical protein [Rhizobacter sp.]
MARASLSAPQAALLLIGALTPIHSGWAADGRPATNTLVLMTTAPKPADGPRASSNGVGVPPAKPVVINPYHVPLLQNAPTFGGR